MQKLVVLSQMFSWAELRPRIGLYVIVLRDVSRDIYYTSSRKLYHHHRHAPRRSVAVSKSCRQRSLFCALLKAAFGPRFRGSRSVVTHRRALYRCGSKLYLLALLLLLNALWINRCRFKRNLSQLSQKSWNRCLSKRSSLLTSPKGPWLCSVSDFVS